MQVVMIKKFNVRKLLQNLTNFPLDKIPDDKEGHSNGGNEELERR